MKYISENIDFNIKNSAVTLGKFDGLHQGHQILIDKVLSLKEEGYTSVMFTFLYHPYNLFSDNEIKLIFTEDEKKHILSQSGLDVLISYPFSHDTKNIEPEDFIKNILVEKLDAKLIVVGNDFRFGRNRRGDINMLKAMEDIYGFKVISFEKKRWEDTIISSSVIRNELQRGHMERVNNLLGRTYFIRGKVLDGRKIGRTIGMPTTNLLPPSNKLLPPCGVYTSRTIIDGVSYPGMTNIGYKPTVGKEKEKGVETYIFDFSKDLYGKEIDIELLEYVRPEIKFDSIEELKVKMEEDLTFGRKFFNI
ncbi:bifunctional riboflavin kinase/FAD synthetase [Herbinix luporum]|uniref:bifunctional riboflavin kinase/FAD synthetase n=1 Tax=Herbinix luporum TaxID=1679721 RepID=UPI00176A979C|nr:bifunctional riboflavin kinase/FAD synthetase [Herbinix luporum]HHT57065.1 bifunctional riboflavin kinase/FAD synthetase [Herbinix luporum]